MRTKTCLSCKHSAWDLSSKSCEFCGPFQNWEAKAPYKPYDSLKGRTISPKNRESRGVYAIGDKVLVNYAAAGETRVGKVTAVPANEDRIEVIYPFASAPVSIHKSAIIGVTYED